MPPFPFGTASGLIKQEGDNPPAYAGKKSGRQARFLRGLFFENELHSSGAVFLWSF